MEDVLVGLLSSAGMSPRRAHWFAEMLDRNERYGVDAHTLALYIERLLKEQHRLERRELDRAAARVTVYELHQATLNATGIAAS